MVGSYQDFTIASPVRLFPLLIFLLGKERGKGRGRPVKATIGVGAPLHSGRGVCKAPVCHYLAPDYHSPNIMGLVVGGQLEANCHLDLEPAPLG
jgi:hypothetical protein